jgi:hypothetical protein
MADLDNPTSERSGPLPDGGVASCVEGYTPEAIAHRAFAFDGVVVDIGPAHSNRSGEGYVQVALVGVTFAVREWFLRSYGTKRHSRHVSARGRGPTRPYG